MLEPIILLKYLSFKISVSIKTNESNTEYKLLSTEEKIFSNIAFIELIIKLVVELFKSKNSYFKFILLKKSLNSR